MVAGSCSHTEGGYGSPPRLLTDGAVNGLTEKVSMSVMPSGLLDQMHHYPAQAPLPSRPVSAGRQGAQVSLGSGATAAVASGPVHSPQVVRIVMLGSVKLPVPILVPRGTCPRLKLGECQKADLYPV